jgi:hypothetical protein
MQWRIGLNVEANRLKTARMKAGMAGQKGTFQEGHQLDGETAPKKIPAKMIGRTLGHKRRSALLKWIA